MKNIIFLFIFCSYLQSCGIVKNDPNKILDFYRQYGFYTNPGKYEPMYANLPDSLTEICKLIKSQLIHPIADLPMYRDLIPQERSYEDLKYPTVQTILAGLKSYDSDGLIINRKPADRLVVSCRYHAILLASILKHKGIPARVRYGFASYLYPNHHIYHVICEVWNNNEKRWMLVDPDRQKIDFPPQQFEFAGDVWMKNQQGKLDPNTYGVPDWWGSHPILDVLCHDLASVLGNEHTYYDRPPISADTTMNVKNMPADQIDAMNNISALMTNVNANFIELQKIYNDNKQLQFSNSTSAKSEYNKTAAEADIKKPVVEWTNIPAGTFTIGSPLSEKDRSNDETQHQVTLSAFKMSKYEITFDQYDMFCIATGRKMAWDGGVGRGKQPVTGVTWYNATAFAEWMGCRLPTEAEWEYAARAGSTTPFYTGNCLNSHQANYDGSSPYVDCSKGTSGKNPMPIGSFTANAYGLYDMLGNVWEWCSDWYGDYPTSAQTNPKGPATGNLKVDRGGGWYTPASRCRSACRGGGDPPENKGRGIGFRLALSE
jgi:formylglycine-generating enzyme